MTEIILDTNILLRHFLGDIPDQSQKATKIITELEESQTIGFLSILVINELIWILKRFYNLPRKTYVPQILKILQINNIKILEIKKELLIKILQNMKKREIDFTDVYLAEIANNRKIVSFDKDLQRLQS